MKFNSQLKKIIKATKETSGYSIPEINDVYVHFIYHLTQEIMQSEKAKLAGLGTISIKKAHKRRTWTPLYQRYCDSVVPATLSIRPDSKMVAALVEWQEQQDLKEAWKEDETTI